MKKCIWTAAIYFVVLMAASCTQGPAVQITENINGAKIAKHTTAHFDFSCFDSNYSYLKELGQTLEDNYTRITTDLAVEVPELISIYVYPDLQEFHNAIGRPDAPEGVVGTAMEGSVYMVSPYGAKIQSYDDMLKTTVHEFVHVTVFHLNSDYRSIPRWLNEGIAAYESGQIPETLGVSKYPTLSYPTLNELNVYDQSFNDLGGYAYSYTLAAFIIDRYGWEKLRALIVSYSDFETILGISEETFYSLWTDYADQNYK